MIICLSNRFQQIVRKRDFSIQDWHKLLAKLQYKSQWYSKKLVLIDMKEQTNPSTNKKSLELVEIGKQVLFE